MIIRLIDGTCMTSRAAAHDELVRALELPEYYGRNLDALWDLATTLKAEAVLLHADAMLNAMGAYGERLLQTLTEAADKNPDFIFRFEHE